MHQIYNVLKRITTSDKLYFDEQFMYGHREILLNYSKKYNDSLTDLSILKGSIDHAWAFDENLWKLRNRNLSRANRYVWNFRQEKLLSQVYSVKATGAPWLYMLNNLGISPENVIEKLPKKNNKVLIFPSHNLDWDIKLDLSASLKSFKSRVDQNSVVVVCLFWLDFIDPKIRRLYLDEGWEVVCAGYCPRGVTADSIHGGRQSFLLELFNIMSDANVILTDDLSTGLIYALSLGVKVQYFTNTESVRWEKDSIRRHESYKPMEGFYRNPREWFENYFPSVFATEYEPKSFVEFAWDELGYNAFNANRNSRKFEWIERKVNINAVDIYVDSLKQIKSLKNL